MRHLVKSSVLALALMVGGGVAVRAQMMHMHHHDAAHETKMLTKKLALTPDQAAQVQPILADRQQKMQALKAATPADKKAMHDQRMAIMSDTEQRLNGVLNDAQKQQFAAMKEKHHHHGHKSAGAQAPAAAK